VEKFYLFSKGILWGHAGLTMTISSTTAPGYVLEPIRQGPDFTLYRGWQEGNSSPFLVVARAAEQPSPQSLRRLARQTPVCA
jgi:hypothetical protein